MNLWKQARHPGSKVYPIKTIKELSGYLESNGTIHPSKGDGRIVLDKQTLYNTDFEGLKNIIKEGIVYVEPTY